ncbi:MAG: hypothetical protein H0W89_00810 [Candidatus Levybacteria bacterium]|nr:hypothetical protein [Candidatus Levybacteria bacterium]
MSAFHIKLLAITLMIIDHIGLFFFPENFLFRTIGRLSFPLFAWLIANGAYHTRNINKYLFRLFIFALISQIPYTLAHQMIDPSTMTLNIFFTLSIGLAAITLIKLTKEKWLWLLIVAVSGFAATILHTDYGGFGVLSIIAFYIFFKNRNALIISQICIYVLMSLYFISRGNSLGVVQSFGLLSLPLILAYNNQEGTKSNLFYLIYPLHYVVIYFLLSI